MESYRPLPLNRTLLDDPQNAARAALDNAAPLLRRLLPFPSSADLAIPLIPARRNGIPETPAATALPSVAGQQALNIVAEAAAILDEEMAKGVLAARGVSRASDRSVADSSNPLLRQVHDLIDDVATRWSSLQNVSVPSMGLSQSPAAAVEGEALPQLAPAAALRPGQRAVISMILSNEESRPVCLAPTATDLLGSADGRIAGNLMEFVPREIHLQPGERKEMTIAATIPAATRPGCYSGMLVVRGVDYLRALIAIEII